MLTQILISILGLLVGIALFGVGFVIGLVTGIKLDRQEVEMFDGAIDKFKPRKEFAVLPSPRQKLEIRRSLENELLTPEEYRKRTNTKI